jgi:folylpolyglutamate synthase/dihydropteroate synthase
VNVPQLKNYSILVDGAHNTGGAAQLRKYIDNFLNAHWSVQKVIFLFGASASKDLRGILRLLLQPDDELFALPFSTPERMPWVHSYKTSDIVATVKSLFPHFSCLEFDSFKSVFAFIAERFLQLNAPVPNSQTVNPLPNVLIVLCGSLYLLADFYRYLGDDAKPYLWEEFGPVLAADNKTHKIQE